MDWKYKHFEQSRVFQADRKVVYEAVRAFAADWLAGWQLSETPDGLEATGRSFGQVVTAKFLFEPATGGTKLTLAMQVENASAFGFMLVDVGGYFNGQIYKWLQALPWWIDQKRAEATPSEGQPAQAAPAGPATLKPSRPSNWLAGCVLISVAIGLTFYFISALVGLLTGNLFINGRGTSGTVIHGMWARILSAIVLGIFCWMVFRNLRPKKRDGVSV